MNRCELTKHKAVARPVVAHEAQDGVSAPAAARRPWPARRVVGEILQRAGLHPTRIGVVSGYVEIVRSPVPVTPSWGRSTR